MEKGKYWISALLLLVVLTSSIYLVLNDSVRIDIQTTRSIFSVNEDGSWVVSGIEYVNLFDGTAKMRASERAINTSIEGNITTIVRTASYKNNISVIEVYTFDGSSDDVTLFPVSHTVEVLGADRPERQYILQYEVQKLLYTGETTSDVTSPQSFGHQMTVEWDESNYYSKIYKYSLINEGKLTVKYRIDSDDFNISVRLFDPPSNQYPDEITITYPTTDLYYDDITSAVFNTYPYDISECYYSKDNGTTNSTPVSGASITKTIGDFERDDTFINTIEDGTSYQYLNTVNLLNDEFFILSNGYSHTGYKYFNGDFVSYDALSTFSDSDDFVNGIVDINPFSIDGTNYLIGNTVLTNGTRVLLGYIWDYNGWERYDDIISGIVGYERLYELEVINISNSYYAITSEADEYTSIYHTVGYLWGGSSWSIDSTVLSGLPVNDHHKSFTSENIYDEDYLIIGDNSEIGADSLNAYVWGTGTWTASTIIDDVISNITTLYWNSRPLIFNLDNRIGFSIVGTSTDVGSWFREDINEITIDSDVGYNYLNIVCTTINNDKTVGNLLYNINSVNYSDSSEKTNATYVLQGTITTDLYGDTSVTTDDTINLDPVDILNIANFNNNGATYAEIDLIGDGIDLAKISLGDLDVSKGYNFSFTTDTTYRNLELPNVCKIDSGEFQIGMLDPSLGYGVTLIALCWNGTAGYQFDQWNGETQLYNYSFTETSVDSITQSVDVNPLITVENITYSYYNSTDLYTVFFDNETLINTFTIETIPMFFNVTVYDTSDNRYDLEERYIANEEITLSIDDTLLDQIGELGADFTINATGDTTGIFVDISAPEYGVEYISDTVSSLFNLSVNYFRKTIFSNGDSEYNITGSGTYNDTILITSHQYDDVDSVSINLTGYANELYPKDVTIYNSNKSTIDKIFPGYLIGNKIYQNEFNDGNFSKSLFFSSLAPQIVTLLADESSIFESISFNIYGEEYGFTYEDEFNDNNIINNLKSKARFMGGLAIPYGNNLKSFIYDNSTIGSILNELLWGYLDNGHYWIQNSVISSAHVDTGDEYEADINNYYSNGDIVMYSLFTEDTGSDEQTGATLNNYIIANYTELNSWTTKDIDVEISYMMYGDEDNSQRDCTAHSQLYLGLKSVWSSPWQQCEDDGLSDCAEYSASGDDFAISLSKNDDNSWTATFSGSESTYGNDIADGRCGDYKFTYDYDAGTYTKWYQYNDPDDDCPYDDSVTTISNTKKIYDVEWNTTEQLKFNQYLYGHYNDEDNEGCQEIESTMTISVLNHSLYNITNSSLESSSIFTSNGNIEKSTMSFFECESCSGQDPGSEIDSYISADNGDNFETVVNGIETSFSNQGTDIKYKFDFKLNETGYVTNSPFITYTDIDTEKGYPENISFDIGSDGIIDYEFEYMLNSTNSPTTIEILDYTGEIVGYNSQNNILEFPITVTTDSIGEVIISNLDFIYLPNPISIDTDSIYEFLDGSENTADFPITIEATGGNITVNDLKYDYAGGNSSVEVLAHNADYSVNVSRIITYLYSAWNYMYVPENVYWIFFAPNTPSASSVTPYGQSTSIPIMNITNYGYGEIGSVAQNTTLSLYIDGSSDCVDLFYGHNSTIIGTETPLLYNEWNTIAEDVKYLDTIDMYLWADYNCTYSTWNTFEPTYYFRQCVDGGKCSTEII